MPNKPCCFFIVCALLPATATNADVPPFTATGTIMTEVFQEPSVPATRMEEAAVFCYSNGWWRIELRYKSGFHSRIPAHLLEGQAINSERIVDGNRILTGRLPTGGSPPLMSDRSLVADVEATEFPPPERRNLFACWLTLFPKPELPILTHTTMRRLVSAEFLNAPENVGTYNLAYSAGGDFISRLSITNNGIIQVGRRSAGQPTRKLAAPFDAGHLEFEYKVLEWTNWNGLQMPIKSLMQTFVAIRGGTSPHDVRVAVIETFTVESLRSEGTSKPQLESARTIALDNRLPPVSKVMPVTYVVTNDEWMAATNPALTQIANTQSNAASTSFAIRSFLKSGRARTIVLSLALALVPLFIYLAYKTAFGSNHVPQK